jgi:large subunit ribosomal protein L3
MIGLIGRKVGMTRLFGQDGRSLPVTAILAGPCYVIQIRTDEREGYQAVQLGAFDRRKKLVKKPQRGHFAKAGVEPKAKLAEFRVGNTDLYQPGQELRVNIFTGGDRVNVVGTSKGKGFEGTVKRWGFAGGPKSHGQSDRHRAPGSIGGASWPSRVWKGMKMAGRMGSERVTVRNLEVVKVDLEQNLVMVKGAVPGARNGYVLIQRTTELKSLPTHSEEVETTGKEAQVQEKTQEAPAPVVGKPEVPVSTQEQAPGEAVPDKVDEAPAKKETSKKKSVEKTKPEEKAKTDSSKETAPQETEAETPASSREEVPEEIDQNTEVSPERKSTGEKKEV